MTCSLFSFFRSLLRPVAAGGLVGLAARNKLQDSQSKTWNTINHYNFCQFSKCQAPYWKFSSDGFEYAAYSSFVHKKPNLTQMKQEFKYVRAQQHGQLKILDGSKCLVSGEQQYYVWDTAS